MKKAIVTFVLTAIFVSCSNLSCLADNSNKVRVGFYDFPYFQEIDEDGNYSGYSYEYLQAIAQFAGWEYEYVTYATSSECLELLKNGEIDLMGVVQRTPEREAIYDYPELNSGYSSSLLITDKDDLRYAYEDFESFDGMTVGIQKSFARNRGLADYCEKNGFSVRTIIFETKEAMLEAVASGAVDAVLISSNQNSPEYRVIAKFTPSEVYYITTKGNERVLDGLNKALEQLKLEAPAFDTELYKKYYDFSEGQPAVLSKSEQEYIKDNPRLNVMYDASSEPFEGLNENGEPCGISIDIMEHISKAVGISFNYVQIQSGADDGTDNMPHADRIFSSMVYDYGWANKHDMLITQPYIDMEYVTIYKKNDAESIRIALSKDEYMNRIAESYVGKDLAVSYYDSLEECLNAIERGDADYTFANSYECEYFLSQAKYSTLNFRNLQAEPQQLSVGISKDADPRLYSVIAKGLQSISGDEMTKIIRAHINHSGETNFVDMLYTNPKQFLLISAALLLLLTGLIFALILYWINRKKKKQLESAISVKSSFLSSMSHDMRTPMNAIIGMSYLGMSCKELSESKRYHSQINKSGKYLLNLINDTLDMSKIEQNKMRLNPEPCYYAEFIDSIRTMLQKKAEDKGVSFIVQGPAGTEYGVLLDKQRLQQIFINLINNAIKFTPSGGTLVFSVDTEPISDTMLDISFTVRDNGIGMSDAFQEKMFLPFEQEQSIDSSAESGTGLGLSIVHELVELMGGEIKCRSKLGQGTEFVVRLSAEIVREEAPAQKKTATEAEIRRVLSGKRILLAEDQPLNTVIAVRLLEQMGLKAETVENGRLALEKLSNAPPHYFDAILMDIRMPVMDGLLAAAAIRKLERADAQLIPIIAMTANAFEEDIRKSKEVGMNAHLAKPIEPKLLYQVLYDLINGEN